MKIAVCIKQVPVLSAMQLDPQTRTLRREGVPSEVSSFDVRAVLKAVALAHEHGGEACAITMGPPQARAALLECLALGCGRAVHLCDRALAGSDTLATARALGAALRRESFDLVLCGRNSTDAETGQVGPEVAELLDLPLITSARTLEITGGMVRCEREIDGGFETVEAPLPALVTAAEDVAAERFPTKAERAAAAGKPIVELDVQALGLGRGEVGDAGSPTQVVGLQTLEENRQGRIIDAPTLEAAAEELIACLREHGLFSDVAVKPPRAAAVEARTAAVEARTAVHEAGGGVLVVAEMLRGQLRPVTHELLGKARELAATLGGGVAALIAGRGARDHIDSLAAHGAQRVYLNQEEGGGELQAALLDTAIDAVRPAVVLLPSTALGREVAPRVAARRGLGLTGDCIDLSIDAAGRVLQHKPAFGGRVVALIVSRTAPVMATVRPGMLAAAPAEPGRRAEVVALAAPELRARVRRIAERSVAEEAAALDHARVVVGVGNGIGGPENLPLLRAFADAIGGMICTTRDVTDKGWLPRQYQVGLTGRAVAPAIYVAVAIRGAFEHMVGVRRAGLIVAINKNPRAPIFKSADLGVVADYAALLPLLIDKLRRAKSELTAALSCREGESK